MEAERAKGGSQDTHRRLNSPEASERLPHTVSDAGRILVKSQPIKHLEDLRVKDIVQDLGRGLWLVETHMSVGHG